MVFKFIATAGLCFLAACAAPPKFDYVKANTTSHDKESAVSECIYQIRLNKTPAAEQADLERMCMQGKGYRYQRIG